MCCLEKSSVIRRQTTQLKKWAKHLNRHITEDNMWMARKPLKRCLASLVIAAAAAAAKSLQSCLTVCDPRDGSPPGSPIPGILQARTLEWVAISCSNEWKWKVKAKSLSCLQLFATPWTAAHQASPSMGFSRQKYWSGVHVCVNVYVFSLWG